MYVIFLNYFIEKEEEGKDDEGLSIFGIPIPKIPFPILSFGLAPTTLSHGLLPIGRKGDPSADSEAEETNNRRKTSQEITRGPDNVDPIWLETLINGAKYLINNNNGGGGNDEEESKVSEDRVYNQYVEKFNEKVKNKNYYPGDKNKYLQPQNPVIPLSAATKIQQQGTPLPYYPPNNVPAIKFDHPVQINGLQYPQPISPAPGLQPHSYPAGPPTAEDGFIPLFMPDKSDPVLTQRIEKLPPEGYTLPNYGPGQYPASAANSRPSLNFDHIPEYPLVYPKPPQQLPAQEIPIVYAANSYEQDTYPTRQLPVTTISTTPKTVLEVKDILDLSNDYYYTYEDFPKYESVPEAVVVSQDLKAASTSITTEETISTTQRKIPTLKVQEILPAMGSFREPGQPVLKPDIITTTSTTTELTPAKDEEEEEIPSEEITTKEPSEESSDNPASSGDVVYEYEYYYEYYDDPNAVKSENNNSIVTMATSKADEDVTSEATVASSSGFSLQNILNLITKTVPAATEVTASETKRKDQITTNAGDSKDELFEHFTKKPSLILPFIEQPRIKDQPQQVRIPKEQSDFRPTPETPQQTSLYKARSTKQPPTSTQNLVNYLENRRSTVSVDSSTPIDHRSRAASGRSTTASVLGGQSSTPSYPFYPDRLDPAKVHGNNEVKWYYSNYHTENVEPYVDPRFPRENSEAAKVHSSASSISINVMLFCIMFAHYF